MSTDKSVRTITEIKKGADKEIQKAIKLLQTELCVPINFPKELNDIFKYFFDFAYFWVTTYPTQTYFSAMGSPILKTFHLLILITLLCEAKLKEKSISILLL